MLLCNLDFAGVEDEAGGSGGSGGSSNTGLVVETDEFDELPGV